MPVFFPPFLPTLVHHSNTMATLVSQSFPFYQHLHMTARQWSVFSLLPTLVHHSNTMVSFSCLPTLVHHSNTMVSLFLFTNTCTPQQHNGQFFLFTNTCTPPQHNGHVGESVFSCLSTFVHHSKIMVSLFPSTNTCT